MVAFSFNKQFIAPALAGTKIGTIRRTSRHARPGVEIQLYTAMRTKYCRLFGRARCQQVKSIIVDVRADAVFYPGDCEQVPDLDAFAIADGFTCWERLVAFWAKTHPGVKQFEGQHVLWGNTIVPAPDA